MEGRGDGRVEIDGAVVELFTRCGTATAVGGRCTGVSDVATWLSIDGCTRLAPITGCGWATDGCGTRVGVEPDTALPAPAVAVADVADVTALAGGKPARAGRSTAPVGVMVAGRTGVAVGRASKGELARICASCTAASGRPWFTASACSLAANGIGAAGGIVLTITGRFTTVAGGVRIGPPCGADAETRLARVGTTVGAAPNTGAERMRSVTVIGVACTGRALANVVLDVAMMAPGTARFR